MKQQVIISESLRFGAYDRFSEAAAIASANDMLHMIANARQLSIGATDYSVSPMSVKTEPNIVFYTFLSLFIYSRRLGYKVTSTQPPTVNYHFADERSARRGQEILDSLPRYNHFA